MELPEPSKLVVGTKQVLRALSEGKALKVYIAKDADEHIKNSLYEAMSGSDAKLELADGKKELGDACGIKVGSACAALVK